MNTKEQLRQKIISSIHGLPYEEAIEKEYIQVGALYTFSNMWQKMPRARPNSY